MSCTSSDDPELRHTDLGGREPERALGRVMVVARGAGHAGLRSARTAAVPEPLEQAIGEARGRVVDATSSVTAALRAAGPGGEVDVVVVVCAGIDRFADEWAGPRLLQRLRARTDAVVVAAVPAGDVDGAAHAARAGASLLTVWPATGQRHGLVPTAELLAGFEPGAREAAFTAWFAARYELEWQSWMAEAAAAVAVTADRDRQAEWCRPRWSHADKRPTVRRLREFRTALTGEVRDERVLERRAALEVLRALGRVRWVGDAPPVSRSLRQAAAAIRHQPELLAGVIDGEESALLLEVDAAMRKLAARENAGPGRPPSGEWRAHRQLAAGRLAAGAAGALPKAHARDELLMAVDDLVLLVHDALDDAACALQ